MKKTLVGLAVGVIALYALVAPTQKSGQHKTATPVVAVAEKPAPKPAQKPAPAAAPASAEKTAQTDSGLVTFSISPVLK